MNPSRNQAMQQAGQHATQGANVRTEGARLTHGQMPCPDCNHPIVLPFEALIAGQPIGCAHCGISLAAEVEESAQALEALRKAKQMLENLSRIPV